MNGPMLSDVGTIIDLSDHEWDHVADLFDHPSARMAGPASPPSARLARNVRASLLIAAVQTPFARQRRQCALTAFQGGNRSGR